MLKQFPSLSYVIDVLQQCQRFCLFDAVLKDCDCFHPLYLERDGHRQQKDPCDLGQTEVSQCLENIETQFATDLRCCNCNATCREVNYHSVLSSSLWPSFNYEVQSVFYELSFFATLIYHFQKWTQHSSRHTRQTGSSGKTSTTVGRDQHQVVQDQDHQQNHQQAQCRTTERTWFMWVCTTTASTPDTWWITRFTRWWQARLEIEFHRFYLQTLYSTAMTWAIGGQISLFLGISIAMLFEVLEIILDLTSNIINWVLRKPLGRPSHVFWTSSIYWTKPFSVFFVILIIKFSKIVFLYFYSFIARYVWNCFRPQQKQ